MTLPSQKVFAVGASGEMTRIADLPAGFLNTTEPTPTSTLTEAATVPRIMSSATGLYAYAYSCETEDAVEIDLDETSHTLARSISLLLYHYTGGAWSLIATVALEGHACTVGKVTGHPATFDGSTIPVEVGPAFIDDDGTVYVSAQMADYDRCYQLDWYYPELNAAEPSHLTQAGRIYVISGGVASQIDIPFGPGGGPASPTTDTGSNLSPGRTTFALFGVSPDGSKLLARVEGHATAVEIDTATGVVTPTSADVSVAGEPFGGGLGGSGLPAVYTFEQPVAWSNDLSTYSTGADSITSVGPTTAVTDLTNVITDEPFTPATAPVMVNGNDFSPALGVDGSGNVYFLTEEGQLAVSNPAGRARVLCQSLPTPLPYGFVPNRAATTLDVDALPNDPLASAVEGFADGAVVIGVTSGNALAVDAWLNDEKLVEAKHYGVTRDAGGYVQSIDVSAGSAPIRPNGLRTGIGEASDVLVVKSVFRKVAG